MWVSSIDVILAVLRYCTEEDGGGVWENCNFHCFCGPIFHSAVMSFFKGQAMSQLSFSIFLVLFPLEIKKNMADSLDICHPTCFSAKYVLLKKIDVSWLQRRRKQNSSGQALCRACVSM